ncbi:MAG: S8 family serine peptidase [Caldilineaceae bacterium]
MEQKNLYPFCAFWIVLALLMPVPSSAQSYSGVHKIQGYLAQLAQHEPDEVIPLIVQTYGDSDEAERLVRANGGEVTRRFSIINAFAAVAPTHVIAQLATSPTVRWVALDAPMESQTTAVEGSVSAQDEFTSLSFHGSDGAFAWQSDWQELGETDGASQGDIAVANFWGGALQGLRLQGAAKGALRHIDLTNTSATKVHVAYRRKSFLQTSDYVTLELSKDEGATWTELVRWSGPMTDVEIQHEAYDIASYQGAQVALRFVTSPTMGPDARFYLDRIAVEFVPTWEARDLAAHSLYLPFVSNQTTADSGYKVAATQDKMGDLRQIGQARSSYCWSCINLNLLQSTYVKAIHANDLWNVWPYPRGWGITVAVVDSGISPHPDLKDYWGASRIVKQVNFVPDSSSPDDFYGHGTHVAGTIAGLGQASGGHYLGVAPEAKLVDVKVMDDWGYGTTSDVIAGLQWVYENRATYNIKVVNLSLNSRVIESYHESALDAALEVLWFNKIVVVVSAGNGGKQQLYPPANDPFVITVGAADDVGTATIGDDALPSFSAYGMTADGFLKPDLVAPGANIVAPLSSDDNNLTWAHPENKMPWPYDTTYYRMSGTSMAAGVVAGAVAILLEDEPNLTPDQVKYRLMATAQPFNQGESCTTGAGYLDIYNAVNSKTTQSANTGVQASQMLWSGSNPITWGSVSWNSVSWNSVSWNSVSWNSVSWNSVSWNSVSWNSNIGNNAGSGSCTSAFKKVMLVNADTDRDIQPLFDSAIINIDALGTRNLSVRVETVGSVESVKFDLNNGAYTKVENAEPYALAGDNNGDYAAYNMANGIYTLQATAYPNDNAGGAPGAHLAMQVIVAGANRCELEGELTSQNANTPMHFKVDNDSSQTLELFWLDYNGQRQSYGMVLPGKKWSITTYVSYPWVIARDWDNSCVRLVPDPGAEAKVKITDSDLATGLNTDSGFETGTNNNWGRNGATVVNTNARSGNYAMRITGNDRGIWQTVGGLQPNTTYRLHGFLKGGTVNNGGYLYVKNYGGNEISTYNQRNDVKQNRYSEFTVTFTTGSTNTDAQIGVWRLNSGSGELYVDDLQLAKVTFDGIAVLTAVHSGRVLDVAAGNMGDGANVLQWDYHDSANQKWRIEPMAAGGYQLVSVNSGKCLDVAGNSTGDGANVLQWTCHGGANQQWRLESLTGGIYQLVAVHSNKCLDVASASPANSANVQQWTCNGTTAQQWRVDQ